MGKAHKPSYYSPVSIKRFAVVLAVMTALAAVVSALPSYGAVPKLDQIRVAIFLNLPGKYTTTVPTATFSATDVLNIGIRHPSGVEAWFQQDETKQARFALNDYKVHIAETSDFNTAVAIFKRVQNSSKSVWLTSLQKSGKTMYQVTEGTYLSKAEAKAAADRWGSDAELLGLTAQKQPVLMGPFFLETGSFASLAEARKSAAAAGAAGLNAFIGIRKSEAGKLQYTVQIGAETDSADLSAIRKKAEKETSIGELNEPNNSRPYMQLRNDHTLKLKSSSSDSLYIIPGSGTNVWLSTEENGTIKLDERYNRSYRGQFEVSGFNNQLAVVNQLPFEQYLYSVVGAEMPASWPEEALKAQAVAARSYAVFQGFGFQIAHVVDSVLSQEYRGIGAEKPATIHAVDATAGEIAVYEGKVIEALFSSNAGGVSANASEIWGKDIPYLTSIPSPDQGSETGLHSWYRVVLTDGRIGYVREDLAESTGEKTSAGSAIMRITGDGVMIRPIPLIQSEVAPVAQVNSGTRVIQLEKTIQSNEMTWIRGPFTSEDLLASMQGKLRTPLSDSIDTLEVDQRGPSGRVTGMSVNGEPLDIRYPDMLRSALGGLPSTRFEVDETGRITIAGAGNARSERPAVSQTLYMAGADLKTQPLESENVFLLDGSGNVRAATKEPAFRFTGKGYGHGVGMSQWGAKGLAEKGYDYQRILKYYYNNVTVTKE